MSLQVWLPLTKDLRQQGLDNSIVSGTNITKNNSGKLGSCYSFNGSSSYLLSNSSPFSNSTDNWSYACWFKPNNQHQGCLFSCRTGTNSTGMTIFYYNAQILFDDGTRWQFTPSTAITTGAWNHLVFVRKKGVGKYCYLNGQLVGSTSTTGTQTTVGANYAIGNSQSANTTLTGNPLNGYLNDVRIYDHALSQMEVKELAKGLVLHYPLDRQGWGQENLLISPISSSNWGNWHGTTDWANNNVREKIVIDGKTWAHVHQYTASSYGGYSCAPSGNGIVIDASKKYTWSCTVKPGEDTNAEIILWYHWRSTEGGANLSQNSKKFTVTGTQRISYTLPQYTNGTYTVNRINLMMGTSGTANNEIYFTDVKFEEGSIATPWCPNSSDALATTMGLNSTTEYDCSGYCNNGEKVGTLTYLSDTSKYAVCTYFNGSSAIKNTNFPFTSSQWTVAFWYKFTTAPTAYQGFICLSRNSGADADKKFAAMPNSTYIWFKFESISYTLQSRKNNEWCHIVMTCDGTNGKVYENGILKNTTGSVGTILTDCDDFVVGARANSANAATTSVYLNGNMSDVRIYATALSADDVKSLYQNCATIDPDGTIRGQIRS